MAQPSIEPYLFFGGRCEEAINFYKQALGAEVEMMMRFSESPQPPPPGGLAPGFENKIMHSSFVVGGARIMASDGCAPGTAFSGFSLSYCAAAVKDAERAFAALSSGGQVNMPLAQTFWSPCFGMLTDRFGISWMVSVPGEGKAC